MTDMVSADQQVNTYHPSPFGIYNRVRLGPREDPLASMPPSPPPVCTEGMVYYDETLQDLQICIASTWTNIGAVWKKSTVGGNPVVSVMADDLSNTLRVGINTVNPPKETLEVRGAWWDSSNYDAYEGNVKAETMKIGTDTQHFRMQVTNRPGFITGTVSANNQSSNVFLPLRIDGEEILFNIDPFGSPPAVPTNSRIVGIGVSAPRNQLHVREIAQANEIRAEMRPTVSGSTVTYHTIYGYMRGANPVEFGAWNGDSSVYHPLDIQAQSEVLMQTNAVGGRVGIGTSDPDDQLHVAGTFRGEQFVFGDLNFGTFIEFKEEANPSPNFLAMVSWNIGASFFQPIRIDANPLVLQYNSNGPISLGRNAGGSGNRLEVQGNTFAQGIFNPSDERLKKDIKPIDSPLEKLSLIQPVSYQWKDPSKEQKKQIGVVAQDVEKVFPEVVKTDNEGMKSVSYASLVAPLIEAVKELQQEHEELKARLAELEADVVANDVVSDSSAEPTQ
ncbi:MAG: tail fiber domain-containing protein [Candidatus Omnitrophica bacterium]|nr:tail fiber domain-containing protein [Candidatus Omnitrophota bacterium]